MDALKRALKASFSSLAAAGLAFAFFHLSESSTSANPPIQPTRPAAADGLAPVGTLAAGQHLHLALGLPLRNESELSGLLHQLYDPAHPNYRQWWTPEQLAARFGATEQDCQAVADWAQAHHLTVSAVHPNRVVVDVEGAVADIENAFNVRLRTYNHPTEKREFYAPETEPSMDLSVPILSIAGLDNYALPRPKHHIDSRNANTIAPRSGSAPGGGYMGGDFRAAYVPGTALNGTGQTIGLLQFDGFYSNDIVTYESMAGLPNVQLTVVPIDGGVSTPGSGNSEVCLDIEMVISMAPGIGRVYVYEAPNPSPWIDLLSRMQTDNLSKQLSCSWGGGGPDATSENVFKLMAAQGQSFFNATGDSDAFTSSISFPSDSTNITQVGGTTLTTTGPLGAYVSEKVWNWGLVQGSYVGSSGGVSTYYKIPNYQVPVSMALNQGSTTMRNVPDVALTADNVYVRYNNGGAGSFGGTSCAAPLWAGVMALINQQGAANGLNPVGFMNPPVYNIGLGANYNADFHDITAGDNTWPSSPTKYYATNGYDLCTGWGTPTINIINALAGSPGAHIASNSLALVTESCADGTVDPGETVTMNFGLINTGSAGTSNLVATLQATGGVTSPSSAQAYGVLAASGGSATRSFTFTANGSCGGTITATLQLQDGANNLGTLPFVIGLGTTGPATPLNQNFDGVSTPALPSGWSSVLVSGSQTNWLTTTASFSSAPNAAFIVDSPNLGENALLSPPIAIGSATAQLTFAQNYNLEFHAKGANKSYFDGGVLEISIAGGAFTDIISAGGSFVSGGYNITLASGNPLAGRRAWGGSSAGWVNTTVTLPAAAAGQIIQLRWACAVDGDNAYGGVGWYVDSISISDTVTVCCSGAVAPTIVTQPTNQTVIAGGNASFNVGANGSPSPSYQWYFNGTNLLVGKTAATLSLTNVQAAQAGGYSAIASNGSGSITSAVAQLIVLVPPSITTQPTNLSVVTGSNATLFVTASGSAPLSYQWQHANTNLPGATATALQLINVQAAQAGSYRAIVTNTAGAITSAVASVTVLVPASITSPPTNLTVVVGSNALLNVTASGSAPLAYQWQLANTNLPGATSSTLQLSNVQTSQAGTYRVIVTNVAGSATSSPATLTVIVPASITAQPTNVTTMPGSNAAFYVTASGTAPLTYQWQFANTNLPGKTAATLQMSNVLAAQAGNYQVIVSNSAAVLTSTPALLRILLSPATASMGLTGNTFSVSIQSVSGLVYTLEYKNQLSDASWTALSPSATGAGTVLMLRDTNATAPDRLYRVRTQ